MVKSHNGNQPTASATSDDKMITVNQFKPDIGAPFSVLLIDAVQQKISPNGEVLETHIPNLDGLLKEVAFARALNDRKFSPEDIKFVRKAIGLKASALADLLGVSPEHISRCENGDRTLSISAEKLFRVIALKKRHNPAELAGLLRGYLNSGKFDEEKTSDILLLIDKYKETVEDIESAIFDSRIRTVHDSNDKLEFEFYIVPVRPGHIDGLRDALEECWRPADKLAA